jgi:hypothetical protein
MKTEIAIIIFTHSLSAFAQGTFQNLDFESANIPASTPAPSLVPISEALPGWNAYFSSGGVTYPQSQVYYDAVSLGGDVISLDDTKEFPPLQGQYSVILFGGGNNPYYSASISQTGVIPSGTESLLMDAYLPAGASVTPVVAINGQPINMTPLQSFVHYTVWGGTFLPLTLDNLLRSVSPSHRSRPQVPNQASSNWTIFPFPLKRFPSRVRSL